MYDEESDGGPKGTFEIYKAEADTLFKQGEYRKAIHSYTTALDLQPGDQNCMVSRSKCYLKLGDTAKSLADAEASLAEDKTYHKGLFQKAEALYYKGDFEMALVFYHRGHKLRPELQEFRLGIQKAQEAIDNSVGSSDTVKLTTKGDLSFFQKQDEKKTKKKTYGSYNKQQQKQVKPKREIITNPALEKTVKQLLGELYGDKIYLEKLLKEIDPKSDTGKTIYDLVEEGLSYLDTRTEFWMQQKPMYARQHEKVMQSKAQKTGGQESPNDYIIKELEKIDQAQAEGRFEDSLKRAERCMATVNNYPDSILTNKLSVVANLHSCLGNAFLELKKYAKAEDHHTMDLNIGQKHGIEEAESRGLDNLGRVYARTGKFDKAIQVWEKKIPMSKSDLESTWLYHEVGRCHLELGHLDKAREYGEKSYEAAEKADDDQWQLQATVLIAQAQVKLGELEPALESFEKALDISKVIGDERAEVAIKKAMDEVNAKIVQYMKDKKNNGEAEKAENVAEEGDTGEAEEPKADNSNTENTLGEVET